MVVYNSEKLKAIYLIGRLIKLSCIYIVQFHINITNHFVDIYFLTIIKKKIEMWWKTLKDQVRGSLSGSVG